jgi:hypothetical protein
LARVLDPARDHGVPRCPDGEWEDEFLPQVGEQDAVDVVENVVGSALAQDDLVDAGPLPAVA